MKTIWNRIKNHNKIYSLLIFWFIWLFFVVNSFCGTNMALITFTLGFVITCLGIAYITDCPNEKEERLLNKMVDLYRDENED